MLNSDKMGVSNEKRCKKNENVLNVDIENIIFLFLGYNFYIKKNK